MCIPRHHTIIITIVVATRWDRVYPPNRLMTRVRAWRMIIKVPQVSRFVSTLSQFLSSILPGHETNAGVWFVRSIRTYVRTFLRSRLLRRVTIYSQSSKTPSRRARFDRSTHPARTAAARSFFIRSLIVMIMRAYVYLYGCRCRIEGAINRGDVKSCPTTCVCIGYSPLFKEVIGSTVAARSVDGYARARVPLNCDEK